ncbi:MAG: helix-turn-helix transcriptional regulator [Dethiobacter sp.]|nr:helix-turn-helix transcriptional regulator [Dethiobacter sp.]MCL5982160.1 helix-turn-helix transcriptional regulator [Bacillota bacterium]
MGITQAALATRIGTKLSVVARLESDRANPSIAFLIIILRYHPGASNLPRTVFSVLVNQGYYCKGFPQRG